MVKRGFSLFECMVVISLLGLAIGLTYHGWTVFNRWAVRAEVEKLYAVCRYLQQRAVASGQQQELTFDTNRNEYCYHNNVVKLSKGVLFGAAPNVKGPPSSPTSPIHHPVTFTNNTIHFYSDGVVKSGTVYLSDSAKQCMYALSVPISAIAYMRMYHYDSTWKQQ